MLPYRTEVSVSLWHTEYLEFSVDSFHFIGMILIINLTSRRYKFLLLEVKFIAVLESY